MYKSSVQTFKLRLFKIDQKTNIGLYVSELDSFLQSFMCRYIHDNPDNKTIHHDYCDECFFFYFLYISQM